MKKKTNATNAKDAGGGGDLLIPPVASVRLLAGRGYVRGRESEWVYDADAGIITVYDHGQGRAELVRAAVNAASAACGWRSAAAAAGLLIPSAK